MIRPAFAPAMEGVPARMLRRLGAAREGATAANFAIILPALLMLLLGIMETGRGLWTQNALNYAVEQAARCAAIDKNNCGTTAQIQAYAATIAGANSGAATFTYTVAQCGFPLEAGLQVSAAGTSAISLAA